MNSKILPVFYTCASEVYSAVIIDHFVEELLRDEKKPRWSASVVDGYEKVEMMVAGLFTLGYLGVPVALLDTPCPKTHCAMQLNGQHLTGPPWVASAPMSVRIGREGVATPQRVKSSAQLLMTLPFTQYRRSGDGTEPFRRGEWSAPAANPLRLT